MFVLIFALAASASTPVCQKLTKSFADNERIFAMIHDSDSAGVDSALEFQRQVGPAEARVAIEEARLRAMGGEPRSRATFGPSAAESVAKARTELEKTDAKYMAEGDRITTLLIANKCTPPDHVTTWFTYSRKNPNAAK